MKKAILLITLSTLCIVSSCTKNYVCSCNTIVSDGSSSSELPKDDYAFSNLSKKVAIDSCNSKDTFYTTADVSTTTNCELK
jgi:hypothetical protein